MPRKGRRVKHEFVYEPFDFRTLSVLPKAEDLLQRKTFFPVLPNIVNGRYNSWEQYLDIQFRLLFEDCFRPIQEAIEEYRKTSRGHRRLFKGVRVKRGKQYHSATFMSTNSNVTYWEESGLLKGGSLVCLSNDGFWKTLFVGVITHKTSPEDLAEGNLWIQFLNTDIGGQELSIHESYLMLESESYFESYRHSLEVLQTRNATNFPMMDYIVNLQPNIKIPSYIQQMKCNFRSLLENDEFEKAGDFSSSVKHPFQDVSILQPSSWPSASSMGMDSSQLEAFRTAVTRELAIIQGPPGTGKTFVGLKIVKFFLHNGSIFPSPILIICYTNHALDQFLEGLLDLTQSVFRVGSRSTNPAILNHISHAQKRIRVYEASVIGMTITAATKNQKILEKVKPRIVLMEEAAEVLEGHAFAALSEYTKHLIMIGDHHQLQPHTSVMELERKYNMGVSLFERLVRNKVPYCMLQVQRRMRPCMSDLLVPHIYHILKNHQSVWEYEDIKGMEGNMYFISHKAMESMRDGKSLSNQHEAEFLMGLCRYLRLQGYSADEITVLAMYGAQVHLLEKLKKGDDLTEDVRISTVDGYQGEENEIILLSLVRSNLENTIGFLWKENRVCVALSRARKGLYCIGNFELLQQCSVLWMDIGKKLIVKKAMGPKLHLKCQTHAQVTAVSLPSHFALLKNGGCTRTCRLNMPCGHICNQQCHAIDRNHEEFLRAGRCLQKCGSKLRCGHLCEEKCHLYVSKESSLEYKRRLKTCRCSKMCSFSMECGHRCNLPCHNNVQGTMYHSQKCCVCRNAEVDKQRDVFASAHEIVFGSNSPSNYIHRYDSEQYTTRRLITSNLDSTPTSWFPPASSGSSPSMGRTSGSVVEQPQKWCTIL